MRQHDFEPIRGGPLDNGLRRMVHREKQENRRKQWNEENSKRALARLQTTILDLEREIASLEMSIESELALARDRTSSFALESATVMQSRRKNLVATIERLSEKLASIGIADT